jgi:hypothetical protein
MKNYRANLWCLRVTATTTELPFCTGQLGRETARMKLNMTVVSRATQEVVVAWQRRPASDRAPDRGAHPPGDSGRDEPREGGRA